VARKKSHEHRTQFKQGAIHTSSGWADLTSNCGCSSVSQNGRKLVGWMLKVLCHRKEKKIHSIISIWNSFTSRSTDSVLKVSALTPLQHTMNILIE